MNVPSFRETLALGPSPDGRRSARFHAGWAQGRATFGGIVAAAGLEAMRAEVGSERPLRTLAATFAGPVEPGVDAEIRAEVLREGRAVSSAEVRIEQGGSPRFTASAIYGSPRESVVRVEPRRAPELRAPEEIAGFPFVKGITPEFVQLFEMRFAVGAPPFSGSTEPRIGGWCRFRHDEGSADAAAIVALVDVWPVPVLGMLTTPAPASSITWSMDLLADASDRRTDDWWIYEAEAVAAADGYVQANAWLWDAGGRAVARSTQTVAIFG